MDYMPWHYSTEFERHKHACDKCWPEVNPANPPSAVVPDALRELARWMDTGGPTYHEYEIISMALAGPVFCSDGDACREAARRTFLEAAKLWEANPPKQDIG